MIKNAESLVAVHTRYNLSKKTRGVFVPKNKLKLAK